MLAALVLAGRLTTATKNRTGLTPWRCRSPRCRTLLRPEHRTRLPRHGYQAPPHPHRRTIFGRDYPRSGRPPHNPSLRTGLRRITARVVIRKSQEKNGVSQGTSRPPLVYLPSGNGHGSVVAKSTKSSACSTVIPYCQREPELYTAWSLTLSGLTPLASSAQISQPHSLISLSPRGRLIPALCNLLR